MLLQRLAACTMRAAASCAAVGTRGAHASALPRPLAAPTVSLTSRLASSGSGAAWGAAWRGSQLSQGSRAAPQVLARSYGYEAAAAEAAGAGADIGEVDWDAAVANSVRLIGNVGLVGEMRVFEKSKLFPFSIAVDSKKDSPATWVNIDVWGPLADRAAQSIQKGMRVAVEGRLKVDRYTDRQGMEKTSVKVVANSIAKVRRTAGAPTMDANAGAGVPWEAPEAAEIQQWEAAAAAPRASSAPMPAAGGAASTREEQWMDLFENLDQWWDNRTNKRNPKAPDFKKKGGTDAPALWISGRDTPSWVAGELERLDAMREGKLTASG